MWYRNLRMFTQTDSFHISDYSSALMIILAWRTSVKHWNICPPPVNSLCCQDWQDDSITCALLWWKLPAHFKHLSVIHTSPPSEHDQSLRLPLNLLVPVCATNKFCVLKFTVAFATRFKRDRFVREYKSSIESVRRQRSWLRTV